MNDINVLILVMSNMALYLVLCRDTRPVSSRPNFLVPSRDFPIGMEFEGNGRDENL